MGKIISFFEIPALDFERAVKFYQSVCEVELSIYECETEKMACFPQEDGKPTGAIFTAEGYKPSQSGVLISLFTDQMEKALEKVVQNEGKVLIGKTAIMAECGGWFAHITDSEGNRIGLHSDR